MTSSYFVRLLLISSASYFLVQIVVAAAVALFARVAIRRAEGMRPQRAARFLLTLRLLPSGLALIFVAALCVPSYFRFEPDAGREVAGLACLAAAMMGVALCGLAAWRSLGALIRSSIYLRHCGGRESVVGAEKVWIVRDGAGLALAGIVRPRLLVSERAAADLSSEELALALQHEHAHRASGDNLKRLLILMAPALFPGLRTIEKAWARCVEWAADDWAAEGDAERRAALAAALVRVAQLQSGMRMPALATSLVEADEDLSLRVERLLNGAAMCEARRGEGVALAAASLIVIAGIVLNSGGLRVVHSLLERLLD
jgi:hypothetical protein